MVGMLLLLFIVVVGAIMGLYFISASTLTTPYIDTYGNTTSTATNLSQSTMQNVSSTGLTIGGGVLFLVGFIILLIIILALAAVAAKKI